MFLNKFAQQLKHIIIVNFRVQKHANIAKKAKILKCSLNATLV